VTALGQLAVLASMLGALACAGQVAAGDVLVFTRTTGFRHASIPAGIAAMRDLSARAGHSMDATEDPTVFRDAVLSHVKAVIFLNTTGDVLDDEQQSALERWVRGGGGFLGVHSAADTEYGWPFYGELLGARFASHPGVQSATVRVIDRAHPATAGLPEVWVRTDEWYDFLAPPSGVRVLAEVDESTYQGGRMGPHHPIAWTHPVDAGRSVYIAMGHTEESYSEELFRSMLLGALRYAAGDAGSP
jgi:type 1 glutamine amidotransferase